MKGPYKVQKLVEGGSWLTKIKGFGNSERQAIKQVLAVKKQSYEKNNSWRVVDKNDCVVWIG